MMSGRCRTLGALMDGLYVIDMGPLDDDNLNP